jgi:hypothetical protein
LVSDLVESPPELAPYTILKKRLLMSHQLSPVQKAMKLKGLPDQGNRRPSQLLTGLLQVCPPGEPNSAFFHGSFLQCLPAKIQVHKQALHVAIMVAAAVSGKQPSNKKKDKKLVTFCWVHHRFGKDARRCDNLSECQWKEN